MGLKEEREQLLTQKIEKQLIYTLIVNHLIFIGIERFNIKYDSNAC